MEVTTKHEHRHEIADAEIGEEDLLFVFNSRWMMIWSTLFQKMPSLSSRLKVYDEDIISKNIVSHIVPKELLKEDVIPKNK